jgi:hypothetical protein
MGRIIYTRQALPAVELVNFAFDDGDIVIKTDGDGKLAAATRQAIVAFEADCLDAQQAGWSVTAIGPSREVTDPEDKGRLQKMDLSSWPRRHRAGKEGRLSRSLHLTWRAAPLSRRGGGARHKPYSR